MSKLRTITIMLLLFLTFLLPFLSMQNFSPVVDEITHLPSGYSYLRTGEIKLNPQHPPLIKMLAALPLLFMDLQFSADDPNLVGPRTDEWQFGRDLLFNNGVDRLMFWGRIPMILLSVLLGWYVFKWARDLFGYKAGIIGLFIYAFMPNIIAHSQLVTTDLGVAAFSFITAYYLWKLFKSDFDRRYLIYSGIFLGLALGSKFSAVFLLPVFFIWLVYGVHKKYPGLHWPSKVNSSLKIVLPILGLAFLVLWGLYFFPKDPLFYWKGLNTVYADSNTDYSYYLNGNFKQGGWWYYFIWAFIIKTPIPFLAATLAAFVCFRKNKPDFLSNLIILVPPALFLFVASWKAHNIGVRYILPVYPFLILLLAGWYVFSSINTYPDYLAYFNEFVGGSRNGYKYLDDSNIDWGHDLKRLAEYQKKYPDLKTAYAWDKYVNAGRLYGIKNILSLNSKNLWLNPSGKYAVSTHVVARTKLASQVNKDDRMNWMDRYKPVDRIGQSFLIYEFP